MRFISVPFAMAIILFKSFSSKWISCCILDILSKSEYDVTEINAVVSLCFCYQRAGDEIVRLTKEHDEKVEVKLGTINRK